MKEDTSLITLIVCCCSLFGAAMLVIGLFMFKENYGYLKNATTTIGTVVEVQRSRPPTKSIYYSPIILFTTQDDSTIRFTASIRSSDPLSYYKGQKFEVLYKESSPEKAKIKSSDSLWWPPALFGGIGLILFLVGFLPILTAFLAVRKENQLNNLR
jgi:Protein of unknown function (DUF3592)